MVVRLESALNCRAIGPIFLTADKENVRLGPLDLRHTPVLNRQVRLVQVFKNTIIPAG